MNPPRFAAVGAGRMGRGIAIAFAYAGHRIALVDLKPRAAEAWRRLADEARAEIRSSLEGLAALGAVAPEQANAIAARVELVDAAREERAQRHVADHAQANRLVEQFVGTIEVLALAERVAITGEVQIPVLA